MSDALRLLVDVRETDDLRGFHALAALRLIAGHLRPVEVYRLGGHEPDERLACEDFSFDTELQFRHRQPTMKVDQRFDVYLSAADTLAWDETSVAARAASHVTVAALMFGLREFQPAFGGVVVVGHDTAAIAAAVLSALRLAAPVALP